MVAVSHCSSRYNIHNEINFVFILFFVKSSISEIETRLPRSQLIALCRNEAVLKWMSTCDHLMYQALVEILIPDVLRPIPSKILYIACCLGGELIFYFIFSIFKVP